MLQTRNSRVGKAIRNSVDNLIQIIPHKLKNVSLWKHVSSPTLALPFLQLLLFLPYPGVRTWNLLNFQRSSITPRPGLGSTSHELGLLHTSHHKLLSFMFIFNWRVTDLQRCIHFCSVTMWISSKHTYIPSLWSSLPPQPFHPSRSSQSTKLSSLSPQTS